MQFKTTSYAGIDYSCGHPVNINVETGIRYGVICSHRAMPEAVEEFEPEYPDPECECGRAILDNDEPCECGASTEDLDMIHDMLEPIGFTFTAEGYEATLDDYNDIMVLKSPYFTFAQFCSPCAPGACHLENPLEVADGEATMANRAYCLGHDWFDNGQAPYAVFSVETGKRVPPKAEQ